MPETYVAPKADVGERLRPEDTQQNHTEGSSQQQPLPNEHQANQPESSAKTFDPDKQQHQWNDTDPESGVTEGVTQGHASPQQEKSGHGHGGSTTGVKG